jgi:LCP family protein required for cell wall assembly
MKKLGTFLFIALIGALLFGAMYTLRWMRTPLGPSLELSIPPQAQPAAASLQDQPSKQGNQKTCGETGSMALLVSGVSMPEWRPVHGVGAIRLVKVNFDQSTVDILDVPRALYVKAESLDVQGKTSLTNVYRLAAEAAKGNNSDVMNRKATQDMAQVLVDDFDYVPDHYVTVDPAKFVDLVKILGGIDINLGTDVIDGTPDDFGTFGPGNVHLDGQRTLDFLRILHPAGVTNPNVWQKFERQRLVTMALLAAMLQPSNWPNLPDVAKDARQMVVTDLSVNQALNLLCMVKQAQDGINPNAIPDNGTVLQQVSDEEIQILDEPAVKNLIQQYTSDKPHTN